MPQKYKPGYRVGSMTLLELVQKISYGANHWKVLCDCGSESVKRTTDFWKLQTCSYTCPLHRTRAIYPKGSGKERHAWLDMKARCIDPLHPAYHRYGGRGILVCDEWIENFSAFYAHVGPAPNKMQSLDRIDNSKGYEPGNVRWATKRQQNSNKENTIYITANGCTQSLAYWARELKVPHSKLYWRYKNGWQHERIINEP